MADRAYHGCVDVDAVDADHSELTWSVTYDRSRGITTELGEEDGRLTERFERGATA